MLDKKLQLKDGQTIAVLHNPGPVDISASAAPANAADAVLVYVVSRDDLDKRIGTLVDAARRGSLAWLAYPKAKQLGSDLNRDLIHDYVPAHGLDTVRQVALNDTWSALRLKPLS
jgi:hypothetical protein